MTTTALRNALVLAAAVMTVVVVAAAGVHLYGRDRLWQEVAGPADLGPYDFDKPTRTGHPNDALACPAGAAACALAAPEVATPLFALDADALLDAVLATLGDQPRTTVVADDRTGRSLRAVVVSRFFGFPDFLAIRIRAEGPALASLWIYSRSVVGQSDFGTNDRRVARLARQLTRRLPVAPPPPML